MKRIPTYLKADVMRLHYMKAERCVWLALGLATIMALSNAVNINGGQDLSLMPFSTDGVDDAPVISIDVAQGMILLQSLNVTGFYIDENEPTTIDWQIHDGEGTLLSGDLTESLSGAMSTQSASRMKWLWSIDVNITAIIPCSCILELTATDSQNQKTVEWLIIFGDKLDFNLRPQVLVTAPLWTDHVSEDFEVRGFALDDEMASPTVQWSLTQDETVSVACMQSWIQVSDDVDWQNSTYTYASDGGFTFNLDSINFDDGAHILLVRAVDSTGSTSRVACVPVGINNQPPVAVIRGPETIVEDNIFIEFDGSSSEDPMWGRGSLIFVWTLEKVDGGLDDRVIDSGLDKRTFMIRADDSGHWRLSLTVADQGGLTDIAVHEFNVSNVAPIAALRIDGQLMEDGSEVRLSDSKQWQLDATESTDTANDVGVLTYTWYIDGEPQMLGPQRFLTRPDDLSMPHTLSLAVSDDDGETDWVTISFGVADTPSDPMRGQGANSQLNFAIQLALASLFLTGAVMAVVLVTRRGKSGISIPKWKTRKHRNEESDKVNIDQTIDVVDDGEGKLNDD